MNIPPPTKGKLSSYIGVDDFVALVQDGIRINLHIKQRNLEIRDIFRTVKKSRKIVSDRLGHVLENIDIDIYDSMGEMRKDGRSRSRYASWIAGIFDGKIRVIAEAEEEDPAALDIILAHEIVHLAIHEMSKGRCPYWIDEGMAICLSQKLPEEYLTKLQGAIKKDAVLPLEVLENPLSSSADGAVRQLVYAQCCSMTEYFAATYGWDRLSTLVSSSNKRKASSLLSDMSLNYYLLEIGWKRWISGCRA